MPLLFPNLRISQVFGANTDVGKTLLTTALVRSSVARYAQSSSDEAGPSKRVFYLKPVSTGQDDESDVSYVERNTGRYGSSVSTRNLFQYREPMSPHLAAQLAPDLPFPKSNDELIRGVETYTRECLAELKGSRGALYVETAGGVHSPALHPPHTQSTSLLPLRLPSILIASPHLGGISTTLASYESLHLRGYHISAVLCLDHPYYRNHEFLADYFGERGIKFWDVPPPPEKEGTVREDRARLGEWYDRIQAPGEGAAEVAEWLDREHQERIGRLEGMPERTLKSVWWPFTQHGLVNKKEDVMVIDSAHGDNFDAYYTKPPVKASSSLVETDAASTESLLKPYFDGSASWFTQSHGHANTDLTLAAAHAAGRYGHVLFPSGTHEPALNLAEKLKETVGKGWAERVFYSDNGSTGTEVALKMALRAAGRRYGWDGERGGEVGVIGLRGGYHGDTIGSMDATEASAFNKAVDWYKGRGHWFSPPIVQFINGTPTISTTGPDHWPAPPSSGFTPAPDGWQTTFKSIQAVYDLGSRTASPLADYYRSYIRSSFEGLVKEGRKFGAVMMEPTCLGAGGMLFVDPLFQACLIEVVRSSGDLFGGAEHKGRGYEGEMSALDGRDPGEWQGLPIIYDEVFSGLHRFGYNSASSVLSHTPDISVYAKILTGGLLPLSATLASTSIFSAFLSEHKVDALLHGHSYTANPVGCAVALKAVEIVEAHERAGGWVEEKKGWGVGLEGEEGRWSFWGEDWVGRVSKREGVRGVMAMGTVCAIELEDGQGGYESHRALSFLTALRRTIITSPDEAFAPFQIHSRPLGNVVYIITSLFTQPEVMRAMERTIEEELGRA
ncbi:putative Adenosylmethionine-8-amino-7-oxononanoate transaminase [Dioszegia hungarica]|uniref:Adenosylmethionine-8-amino-7-oxononanoate transaminase n=1 Tax=Dioszegia hungarica TaxID=4972 RepID=A0AA38HD75_9TREE|nr:putative Adenosylmethionine-8-amino-7-oxononanoate transaminase [Dioszegia hungarica]KAI9638500.1 putative Adenosylmethionine-8-amino-7-oxononanoate transaminase [Dioszegia hungarica]